MHEKLNAFKRLSLSAGLRPYRPLFISLLICMKPLALA
jgi:hypothetical protein